MKAPTTHTALYENLQQLFGIGNYSELDPHQLWWKYVQVEAAKLKRWSIKRGIAIDDLWLAARYCKVIGVNVTSAFQLADHIRDAILWDKLRATELNSESLSHRVEEAIVRERALPHPDDELLGMLLRSAGEAREEVLVLWQSSYRFRTGQHPPR